VEINVLRVFEAKHIEGLFDETLKRARISRQNLAVFR
jgi:hypothetical protein